MNSGPSRLAMLGSSAILAIVATSSAIAFNRRSATSPPPAASPADGHTIHMLARHVVNGQATGPWHHYCKVISPEPVIECLVYLTADSAARLAQIEYMVARRITRTDLVSLNDWNRNWHDHNLAISSGSAQLLDLAPGAARRVADLVAATDGIIFHLWGTEDAVPSGTVHIGQSVTHVDISERQKFQYPRPGAR